MIESINDGSSHPTNIKFITVEIFVKFLTVILFFTHSQTAVPDSDFVGATLPAHIFLFRHTQ